MAQPKTIFDDVDEAIEEAAIAEANAQIDAGQGVPHEVVGEWLQKLARGEPAKPTFLDD
jgi:predicted transcriptional regulator